MRTFGIIIGRTMKHILGFRQYLRSPKSYEDLADIIEGRDQWFASAEAFTVIVALCGDNPREFLKARGLRDKVARYDFAPWEESPQRVSEVFKKSCYDTHKVQIVHYDDRPLGLTYPLELLLRIGNLMGSDHVAVSDSDFQMPYSEIRRAFDHHIATADPAAICATFPRRKRRSLDAEKYPINRWAMEDIENLYIYLLSDLTTLTDKTDFQSGLSLTSRAANQVLNFDHVGSWIGNLHIAIQIIRQHGRVDNQMTVRTNDQNESTINFQVQLAKIQQLSDYYLVPFANVIHLALSQPDKFLMEDWREGLSAETVQETVLRIQHLYQEFRSSQA